MRMILAMDGILKKNRVNERFYLLRSLKYAVVEHPNYEGMVMWGGRRGQG
jgi:hypothetical protein